MKVVALVGREAARLRRLATVAALLWPATLACAALLGGALVLADGRWLAASPLWPFVIWGGAIGAGVAGWWRLRRYFLATAATPRVAVAIEGEQRQRRGAIEGLLEVAPQGGALVGHTDARLAAVLAPVEATPAPAHHRVMRWRAVAGGLALAAAVGAAALSHGTAADGWRALWHPVAAWRGTLVPPIGVEGLTSRVIRGGTLDLRLTASGRRVLRLRWRQTGGAWRDSVVALASGTGTLRLGPIDADLALLATDGRATTDTLRTRVADRPFLGDVVVQAVYPAYLGRPAERLAVDAPIAVPEGTQLRVEGQASEPLTAVQLVSAAGARIPLGVRGVGFAGTFRPTGLEAWRWEARGAAGPIEDVPAPLEIEVVADAAPRVEIVEPTGELKVGPADRVGLEIVAQDDQQLRGVWLRRSVLSPAGAVTDVTEYRLSDARESEWVGGAVQALGDLALAPGAAVRFEAVARDAVPGRPETVSAPLLLRVPTAAEERAAARDVGEAAVAAARAAAQAQAQLAERTATEARTRTDRPSPPTASSAARPDAATPPANATSAMRFDGAERAKEIAAQQRAMQERVSGLEETAREMEDRLREAGALDTSLARQLQDAQRLLREAMTPELAEALRRVEQSAGDLNAERTRQSLADLAAQQQRMREALEKSAEMLRRAALEGAMKTTADQAQELAQAQRALADSARRRPPEAREAEALARESRELAEAMASLQERLAQSRARTGASQTERAAAEARRSEAALQEAMRQAREAAAAGASPAARDTARRDAAEAAAQAAQAMAEAAAAMQQARAGQVSEWKGELTQALDRSVQEMMQLAQEQEALAREAQQNPSDPSLQGRQSALQQGMQTAQRRLAEQGRQSALLSARSEQMVRQAQQQVSEAARDAAQAPSGTSAQQSMQEAADALRQAAAQLTRDRDRAASAQSASGVPEMLEQLQQLAQQQGQLNGQMQSLLGGAQARGSQGVDAEARARARELARSQREVARALYQVADADPTGRAQEMAREARVLAQALDQGIADPATQARQERLFRRMLDAGRALEQDQQDEAQRRESRAARGTARFTPAGGPQRGAAAERYQLPTWEELRGLSAEERRLVLEYFRALNAGKVP